MTALLLLLLATPVELAVERDGSVLQRAELVLDREAGVLRWNEREYPLSGFYLVEDGKGACLWSPDYAARMRGYELLARARVRDEAYRLFRAAIRYKDATLARRLFELAQNNGLDGKETEKARKSLVRLESKPGKVSSKAASVHEEARRLDSLHLELLFARTQVELENESRTGLVMLREVLREDPEHEQALAAVKARAPAGFGLGDARLWLDWHLDVESSGARIAPGDGFAMRQALKYWRKDLHGIAIGPILVITPVKDTRILGRMLGCCKLTTDLLAHHFARFERRRTKSDPLRIFLFENREEYKKQSRALTPMKDTAFLQFSAGHYSPDEGISRLFWVTNRDAENRIIGTAVHELTHHWLADANPAYTHVEGRRSPRTPGFWIVEGIAEFLQEGVYDLDARTWSLFDRRAASLDTIASMAESGKLIDWKKLYTGTSIDFWALSKSPDIVVRRRWMLGSIPVSKAQLWYMQSAATCQFLYHAENGKYRDALFDYVVNHYTSKRKKMSTVEAFGMEPERLGRRVVVFAKEVANGWEPRGKGAGNDGK
ncbi:MAG: hypothetical protein ACYTHK_17135 [Planctomycetota bacterium]